MDSTARLTTTRATIDLDALSDNYHRLTAELGGRAPAAVVKADAYGLGAPEVAGRLHVEGCRRFFVARLDEGLALREVLDDAEIAVFDGATYGADEELAAADLTPVLNDLGQIERWANRARQLGRALPAALHFDTGMHRLGVADLERRRLEWEPHRLDGIEVRQVLSHLASADEPSSAQSNEQLKRFRSIREQFPQGLASLANSAGIFLGPDYHFDLARPGVALYGSSPHLLGGGFSRTGQERPAPMQPVVTVEAPILQVQPVAAGESVGYGASFRPDKPVRLATIPVGYADGYLRSASNRGRVVVADTSAPVVGRVSMDLTLIDVSHLSDGAVTPGTPVEVLGPRCPIDEVAERAGTIAYELLTGLSPRYHRLYLDEQS
jgi:alanine racemase